MKILKLSILVSLLLAGGSAYGCGPYYYSPADNRIYRIVPPLWKPTASVDEDFATKNILLWSRQTGCTDTAAIRQAIYEGSLAQWEEFYNIVATIFAKRGGVGDAASDWFSRNAFVRHLLKRKDTSAIALLYLSKRYESIRNAQRSPWYYNSRVGTDEKRDLQELYATVCKHALYNDKYANRWHFLAIKCAWATEEREAAVGMWKQYAPKMRGTIFHDEAEDYVARCLEELGRKDEAWDIYRKSRYWTNWLPSPLPARLQAMLAIKPNAHDYAPLLQDYLTSLDVNHAATYGCDDDEECFKVDAVLSVIRSAIANPQVRHKAMWRYAGACILDYKGRQKDALAMLKGAEDGDGDAFLRKSVRILTFHLRARIDSITDDFEQYAIGEIRWLDNEMLREWKRLPQDIRNDISHVMCWDNISDLNKLYSYSALRRIVLEDSVGLAWRMAEAGREVRALQMANVADNHIVRVSDNPIVKKARVAGGNRHDYCNGLFALADRMSASAIEQYRQHYLHPADDLDYWFNARSYNDGDYWQDIIGTHYLRERNYAAAASHFRFVSPSYQHRMNIRCYIDPFSIDCTLASHDSTQYKLHFAQRMDSLQHTMLHGKDADSRGLAMLEYTIGLENSFDLCWWLTSYQKGRAGADLTDIEDTEYARKAHATSRLLRTKALRTLRTNEARARYHLRLGHYSIVRKRYANTSTAHNLALACDAARMYTPSPMPSNQGNKQFHTLQ